MLLLPCCFLCRRCPSGCGRRAPRSLLLTTYSYYLLLNDLPVQAMPLGLRTAVASATAALWRVLLTPVDTLKTTMQAHYLHSALHSALHGHAQDYHAGAAQTQTTLTQTQTPILNLSSLTQTPPPPS